MPDVVLMLAIWVGRALWQRAHGCSAKNQGRKTARRLSGVEGCGGRAHPAPRRSTLSDAAATRLIARLVSGLATGRWIGTGLTTR